MELVIPLFTSVEEPKKTITSLVIGMGTSLMETSVSNVRPLVMDNVLVLTLVPAIIMNMLIGMEPANHRAILLLSQDFLVAKILVDSLVKVRTISTGMALAAKAVMLPLW